MVQAGIRKIYYFPARHWELDQQQQQQGVAAPEALPVPAELGGGKRPSLPPAPGTVDGRRDKNAAAVQRLVMNNSIALSMYIPQWGKGEAAAATACDRDSPASEQGGEEEESTEQLWALDPTIAHMPAVGEDRWPSIQARFKRTVAAVQELWTRYHGVDLESWRAGSCVGRGPPADPVYAHAMVLAHIAAKRTDDPKVGVGAVLLREAGSGGSRTYIGLGWNGFPRKAQHLDYPHAGADDVAEDDRLKYDYILHAEQNALLSRNPRGCDLAGGTVTCIVTKLPCDECSPLLHDCGVRRIVANRQLPKSKDDPARLRGLTYHKVNTLMDTVHIFCGPAPPRAPATMMSAMPETPPRTAAS